MDGVFGNPGANSGSMGMPGGGASGQMGSPMAAITSGMASPMSMSPGAANQMLGNPMGNNNANMMPYMMMRQAMEPDPNIHPKETYARGGLVYLADGGNPMDAAAGQGGLGQMMPPGAEQEAMGGGTGGGGQIAQLVQALSEQYGGHAIVAIAPEVLKQIASQTRTPLKPDENGVVVVG